MKSAPSCLSCVSWLQESKLTCRTSWFRHGCSLSPTLRSDTKTLQRSTEFAASLQTSWHHHLLQVQEHHTGEAARMWQTGPMPQCQLDLFNQTQTLLWPEAPCQQRMSDDGIIAIIVNVFNDDLTPVWDARHNFIWLTDYNGQRKKTWHFFIFYF